MDGRQPDYPASGALPSPRPRPSGSSGPPNSHAAGITNSYSRPEQPPAQQYTPTQDPRSATFPPAATPTSEYGVTPSSARSTSFPDYAPRPSYSGPTQAGAMTQQ